mmetsp:Transcript_64940/g.155049  ORF Transcript_64940/g.155049 Transcript_64940/m.155049 type:complete len:414 (-) Transcript_64940:51-1292(-)
MYILSIWCLWLLTFAESAEEDDILAALGQELESEDCSLLQGRSCDAAALLQTAAAYRWDLKTEMEPSFLQMEEVTNVGEVHTSGSSAAVEDVQKVGEVHADHSQKQQMLQWQEDAVQIYALHEGKAAKAAAAKALRLESSGRAPGLDTPGLWLALLLIVVVAGLLCVSTVSTWLEPVASKEEDVTLGQPETEKAQTIQTVEQQTMTGSEQPLSSCLRDLIQDSLRCGSDDLEALLPRCGGYDCALSKPASSGRAVRLLARIEGPLPGGPPPLGLLRAPVSKQSCVFFSADERNGRRTEGLDFQVSLVGAPSVLVDVSGCELQLESNPKASEDLLQVGAEVVLCGELLRDSRGRLCLQPWDWQREASEPWRTSWEMDIRPVVLASHDTALYRDKVEPFASPWETSEIAPPFLML